MEITDLRVEDFSKVGDLSSLHKPQLFSDFWIESRMSYSRGINCLQVRDKHRLHSQIYVTDFSPNKQIEKVIFLTKTPKFFFLQGNHNIILQKGFNLRLDNFLQENSTPYLSESEAQKIFQDVNESLQDFIKNQIDYICISPKNIVKIDGKWCLSSVGIIFDVDKLSEQYYHDHMNKSEKRIVFALGCLLFHVIFGFVPFEQHHKIPKKFILQDYLTYLENCGEKNSLKIYYFTQKMLSLSKECQNLLEKSLSESLTLEEWEKHIFFFSKIKQQPIREKGKEIQMMNLFGIKNCSLILSAIEYRKKNPFEKLNSKNLTLSEQPSSLELVQLCKKNPYLKYLNMSADFQNRQAFMPKEEMIEVFPSISLSFFYQENFDPEQDFPCRELIKLIQMEKQQKPALFDRNMKREYELKLYGYPYAIAFQLLKVEGPQSLQIRKIIKKTIDLLLQVSALYYPGDLKHLHKCQPKASRFEELKIPFRQNINELYRHFLNEAMRKYNSKKQVSLIERAKQKEKGLEYYRLCLKLLEASLIVRKGGKDLDLTRIETSQRKEIEHDISSLLRQYFPNKAEIH